MQSREYTAAAPIRRPLASHQARHGKPSVKQGPDDLPTHRLFADADTGTLGECPGGTALHQTSRATPCLERTRSVTSPKVRARQNQRLAAGRHQTPGEPWKSLPSVTFYAVLTAPGAAPVRLSSVDPTRGPPRLGHVIQNLLDCRDQCPARVLRRGWKGDRHP